jgi:hypothetical protein
MIGRRPVRPSSGGSAWRSQPVDDLASVDRCCREAVELMAARTGTIQERVYYSCVDRLSKLQPGDFPASVRDRFEMLWLLVTSEPDEEQGALSATILTMSDQEAIEVAAHIVLLARAVHAERCTG